MARLLCVSHKSEPHNDVTRLSDALTSCQSGVASVEKRSQLRLNVKKSIHASHARRMRFFSLIFLLALMVARSEYANFIVLLPV